MLNTRIPEEGMTRTIITKGSPSREIKVLRKYPTESEVLIEHQMDIQLGQFKGEEIYKTVFESAKNIILIIDKNGKIIDVNRRIKDISGYEKEEFIGKSIRILARIMTKGSTAVVVSNFRKQLSGIHVTPYEIEGFKKSGESVTFEVSTQTLIENGKIIGNLAILRDITEQRKTAAALIKSEQNLKYAQTLGRIGNWEFDLVTQKIDWSDEVYHLYERDKSMGPPSPEDEATYYPPEQRRMLQEYARLAVEKGMDFNYDLTVNLPSGKTAFYHSSMHPIKDDKGRVIKLFGTVQDITESKQVEEILKASEEKYRNSLDSSPLGIRIADMGGHTIYANKAFLDIYGYKDIDEYRTTPPQERLTPEGYANYILEIEKQKRNEKIEDKLEINIIRKDGSSGWLQVSSKEMFWNGKKQYQSIYEDITERKQVEEILKRNKDGLDEAQRIAHVGSFEINIKTGKNEWSEELFHILGLDPAKTAPTINSFLNSVHPDDRNRVAKAMELTASQNQVPNIEYRVVTPDGQERYLLSQIKVNRDNNGQPLTAFGTSMDVTERKHTQEMIEHAAEEWRTTFDSITDLISIHDKDNRILRVNKAVADMLKTTPKELVGKFCHEVMHGTKEPPVNCPHLQTLKTGKSVTLEIFNPDLGIHFNESTSPLFNEKGEVNGSVIVSRDITKQKRMEEQLMMTDRLASIGELASGIAHELNNPLTSVIGFSQLLMEGEVPDNIKEDLGIVYGEAQRAAAIVKNLLTFARKHAPVKQLSQVNNIIEDVLRLRDYEQKVNNIEVEKRLAPNLPEIMVDNFQMQQVFLNLIVNAEFAMLESHHSGKLAISTEISDDNIKIVFTDDGPGITKENLKRIFDPFFTTKEVGKGTGLGLSICHGIVTEHGGQIYATSEVGKGATFIIKLPLN
jgi:PAS domain S-box-containing protein